MIVAVVGIGVFRREGGGLGWIAGMDSRECPASSRIVGETGKAGASGARRRQPSGRGSPVGGCWLGEGRSAWCFEPFSASRLAWMTFRATVVVR